MKISSGLYYIFCLYIFIVFLGISDIDLLHDKRGVELKYFNVFISIRWFFLASSFLIAFGYKKSIDENLNLNLDKNRKFKVKRESFNGDVYILLLLVFPLLLIWIINFRTADYQDNLLYISSLIFSIYCSWIFLKIFKKFIVGWRSVFIEIIMYVVIIRSWRCCINAH